MRTAQLALLTSLLSSALLGTLGGTPTRAESLVNDFIRRGNTYSRNGEHDRAIIEYGRAIALNPNFAAAFYNRGTAYNAKGDRDRPIADYDTGDRNQSEPRGRLL